jgi:hypothetical protein
MPFGDFCPDLLHGWATGEPAASPESEIVTR